MNNRQLQILQYLSLASEPITSADLASKFQVSTKTIQNDIKFLNLYMQNSGGKIFAQRGVGYLLRIDDPVRFHRFLLERFLADSVLCLSMIGTFSPCSNRQHDFWRSRSPED